jgi:hypothetical protein
MKLKRHVFNKKRKPRRAVKSSKKTSTKPKRAPILKAGGCSGCRRGRR